VPEWGRKPQEVRQYLDAWQIIQTNSRIPNEQTAEKYNNLGNLTSQSHEIIQALVGCFVVAQSDEI
jgi:hypothetical protein